MRWQLFILALFVQSCAHAPVTRGKDPQALLKETCEVGGKIQSVEGSVWLKAKSKDASGQFPAQVNVNSSQLKMEVTNLVGGREAFISVENGKYRIEIPSRKTKPQEGVDSWGGIPLRWSTDLFLGKIPCAGKPGRVVLNGDGELEVETDEEKFVYTYRSWAGNPWPEALHWESKKRPGIFVDFKFDDPETGTRSPKKWEAKSQHGEVKVRWRDRDVKLPKP